jgi:hypothetical protein
MRLPKSFYDCQPINNIVHRLLKRVLIFVRGVKLNGCNN